jgi:transaminase mtnE
MPGHVFGTGGKNYIRLSLSLSDEQIDTLIEKLELLNNDLNNN